MESHEIEGILRKSIEDASTSLEMAKSELNRLVTGTPDGLQDGLQNVLGAEFARKEAMEKLTRALKEFNAFILGGEVPARHRK